DAADVRWPRQRHSLRADLEVGGAVVDRDAAVGDVREPRLDAFGDVLAATDHEVGVAQPPFDHVSVELAQPLALHVQDELCRGGSSPARRAAGRAPARSRASKSRARGPAEKVPEKAARPAPRGAWTAFFPPRRTSFPLPLTATIPRCLRAATATLPFNSQPGEE